jgi:hypothetical protein
MSAGICGRGELALGKKRRTYQHHIRGARDVNEKLPIATAAPA